MEILPASQVVFYSSHGLFINNYASQMEIEFSFDNMDLPVLSVEFYGIYLG